MDLYICLNESIDLLIGLTISLVELHHPPAQLLRGAEGVVEVYRHYISFQYLCFILPHL